jgi:hypothetical protein
MISCTEFIPAYSLLFEYLDRKNGHDEVVRYWNYISDNSISNGLGKLVEEKGLAGCWEYYNEAHTSEAADVTLTLDEEARIMTINMHFCPSKGKLINLPHMKPYYDYCGHCMIIYKKVLNRYEIDEVRDHTHIDEARCFRTFSLRKSLSDS